MNPDRPCVRVPGGVRRAVSADESLMITYEPVGRLRSTRQPQARGVGGSVGAALDGDRPIPDHVRDGDSGVICRAPGGERPEGT